MDLSRIEPVLSDAGCACLLNEPMSAHTSFCIGGPADIFVQAPSVDALKSALRILKENEIPVMVIGNGSNLLVSDLGIEGAVVKLTGDMGGMELVSAVDIECWAGAKLSVLCGFAAEHSLKGMEFAWGIPGSVGGAAYMNAGAYDSMMSEVVTSVRHIDADGNEGEMPVEELGYGYRRSVYMDNDFIITSVRLHLQPGDPAAIRAKMDELMSRRKEKQPLEYPSAGSVFKRPAGNYAGVLIDQCGLRGRAVGGAQVSEKHAGFIINTGGATCSDVRRLIELIRDEVFLRTSIKLETEIKTVGRI